MRASGVDREEAPASGNGRGSALVLVLAIARGSVIVQELAIVRALGTVQESGTGRESAIVPISAITSTSTAALIITTESQPTDHGTMTGIMVTGTAIMGGAIGTAMRTGLHTDIGIARGMRDRPSGE
jgi:hypothetical protein